MSNELEAVPDIGPQSTIPEPPEPLGSAGTDLWNEIHTTFDLADEPQKVTLLTRACKTADAIRTLEDYAATVSIETTGSMGQKTINGAYAEIRQQTNTLSSLIKALNLPATDEEQAERAERRSRAGKTGANARWSRQAGGSVKR